jgi:hypothetical protein
LQANVLRVGLHDPSALRSASYDGFDSAAAGAGIGTAIAAASHGADLDFGDVAGPAALGAVAFGVADFVAGALVKDVTYSMITDLQILERTDEKVSQTVRSDLEQGSGTRVLQASESVPERRKYQTRIFSTANRVNLSFESALPVLEEDLAKSIAGIL